MAKINIDTDRCKGCMLCVKVCPKASIETDKELNARGVRPAKIKEPQGCIGCCFCALICPDCCIEVLK